MPATLTLMHHMIISKPRQLVSDVVSTSVLSLLGTNQNYPIVVGFDESKTRVSRLCVED